MKNPPAILETWVRFLGQEDQRDRLPTPVFWGFPGGSAGKESACNVGDLGSILGLGRSSGGGHGNPLQCSCLENPMDRGAWRASVHGATKSQTRLNDSAQHTAVFPASRTMPGDSVGIQWKCMPDLTHAALPQRQHVPPWPHPPLFIGQNAVALGDHVLTGHLGGGQQSWSSNWVPNWTFPNYRERLTA